MHDEFVVINYNVHSFLQFDERLERLLSELGTRRWDLLVLIETWRKERCEEWCTSHGHRWFGSGGFRGHSGVGFLLHNRWRHARFKPCSDRAATLDLVLPLQKKICFIAVFFPHGGLPEDQVEALFATVEAECTEARNRKYKLVIAGDFNAEVGSRNDLDDASVIGNCSLTTRSKRGDMSLQ